MLPLAPIAAAGLLGLAALLAARLPRPTSLARVVQWTASVSPLGWYLLGVILGPGVGLLDRALLELLAPVFACAAGWVAARATAEVATRSPDPEPWSVWQALERAGALLVPAALLVTAARVFMAPSLDQWKIIGPVIAVLAAALALAGTASPQRLTASSLALVATALFGLMIPHLNVAELKRGALAAGLGVGGAALATGIATRLSAHASLLPGIIAALGLGAGIGYATGLSAVVVCGLVGFALARSAPYARLDQELAPHEPAATALLWTGAGAAIGGSIVHVAAATLLVSLWPVGRRLLGGAAPLDATLGLALATGFMLNAGPAVGEWERAVLTVVALGLLLARVTPIPRRLARLTSSARRVEFSV